MRRELAAIKEYLQSLLEQQDAANEELRSANEEILSSNEELQSTNEELETAKEELQSTNEELTTVNEQLHTRNLELNEVNNDLTNLLTSMAIPMVMVGADLRIRRYTEAARRSINLRANDIGRPLSDLKTNFDIADLDNLIREVIHQVQVREREVRDRRRALASPADPSLPHRRRQDRRRGDSFDRYRRYQKERRSDPRKRSAFPPAC